MGRGVPVDVTGGAQGCASQPWSAKPAGSGRHSVRRAIQSLAIDGKLRVVQGGGTFVEHAPFVDYVIGRRTWFCKNLLDQGLTPAGEPISAETLAAPADLAQRMGLEDGALVHRFLARGLADDVPISLGLSFHPAARFPALLEQRKAGVSVTEIYRSAGITDYLRKRTTVHNRRAEAEKARLLRQHPDHPVLVVMKTDVTTDGAVIGHSESIWAGARVRLTFDLQGSEDDNT